MTSVPASVPRASTPPHHSSRRAAFAALALAGCLWGTGFVLGKWALRELQVGHMVLYRFWFASLGLTPAAWHEWRSRRGAGRIPRADVGLILAAALLGVPVQFLIQFEGLAHTTVSHASLMVGVVPVLLALGAVVFAHERLAPLGWAALIASTAGAVLIALGTRPGASAGGHPGPTLLGDALVVASLFAAVGWVLLSQRLMGPRGYSALLTSTSIIISGTAMLTVWVVGTEGLPPVALSARTWLSVMALGLLATALTTVLWNWGLARVPASRAGVFVNLEPVIGTILGVLLFHDVLGAGTLVGGVLIIGGAVVITRLPHAHPPDRRRD